MTHLLCTLRVRGRWDPSEERLGYLPPKQPGGARPRLLLPHGPWPGLRTEGLISNELSTPDGWEATMRVCKDCSTSHSTSYACTCLTHVHTYMPHAHTCMPHACTHMPHTYSTCSARVHTSHVPHMQALTQAVTHSPVCTHTHLTCTHTECTYLAHVYMHASHMHTHTLPAAPEHRTILTTQRLKQMNVWKPRHKHWRCTEDLEVSQGQTGNVERSPG